MSTDDPNPSDLPPAVRETLDSLGGALGDIADLDKEQLNETIGLLETLGHDQAAGILRSRREVLKGAGAATGLGLAGLAGATATGGARAQSDTQTGTIGNGNQDADLQDVSAESVNTDILDNIRFASRFTSVQAAIDDLPARGGTVVLPEGRTQIGNLTVPAGEGVVVRLSGYGTKDELEEAASDAGTVLESTVTDGTDLITADAPTGERNRGMILENFAVEGTGSEGDGIVATDWIHTGYATNVAVYNVGGAGFNFTDCFQQQFYGLRAKDCGTSAFDLDNVNVSLFAKCYGHTSTHGFYVDGSYSVGFIACSAEGCSQNGFWGKSGNNAVVWRDCNAEGNAHGYRLLGDNPRIDGGSANTNSNNNVWFDSAGGVASCENVYFDDSGGTTRHILVDNCLGVIEKPHFQGSATEVVASNGGVYAKDQAAVESANAETPQQPWPPGTLVDFSDTGDGSGTGKYLILRDGTAYAI